MIKAKNLTNALRRVTQNTIENFGYKLVKINNVNLPRLSGSPVEALVTKQAGRDVFFECPIDLLRQESGLGFGINQWHPYIATLIEHEIKSTASYEGSILKSFYDKCQPQNAAEALFGFDKFPDPFLYFPHYAHRLSPWRLNPSIGRLQSQIEEWSEKDNREHKKEPFNMQEDGLKYYGPVSKKLGEFEFNRLIDIYHKIKKNGYRIEHGAIGVMMVRHHDKYIFLTTGGGLHRAAAMAALGYETFPAQYKHHYLVDTKDVIYWPQVMSQLWQCDEALAYVNHLFDFDSQSWARVNILAHENVSIPECK